MKRLLYLTGAVALAFVLASGEALGQTMRAGVKGGVTFANLGGDAEQLIGTSLDSRTGFSGGGFFAVDVGRMFRVGIDGQYVQKGAKFTEEGVEVKLKLDYFEFMVPLNVVVPTQSAVTPRFYVGPALAFESTCKVSGEEGGVSVDIDCVDTGVATKSVDFGVFFGGGLDLRAGPGAITLDVLYNLGLSDINDVQDTSESVKNQNIQISAGYAFLFGGVM